MKYETLIPIVVRFDFEPAEHNASDDFYMSYMPRNIASAIANSVREYVRANMATVAGEYTAPVTHVRISDLVVDEAHTNRRIPTVLSTHPISVESILSMWNNRGRIFLGKEAEENQRYKFLAERPYESAWNGEQGFMMSECERDDDFIEIAREVVAAVSAQMQDMVESQMRPRVLELLEGRYEDGLLPDKKNDTQEVEL
jgi:hypothetical protein